MDYSQEDNLKKKKKNKSKKKKVKNKVVLIAFRIFIALFLIGGFAGLGAGVGTVLGIIGNAPKFSDIALNIQPNVYTTIVYEDKTGKEIDRFKGEENREYVSFDKIPKSLKDAYVAIEDERFYSHNGVDIRGVFRAAYVNIFTKRKEGASTITQQLIKNNVLDILYNTFETKIQEQYLAIEYEKALVKSLGSKKKAKDYILEVYLNTIGLHHGLNGVQTAASFYFDKDVSELTIAESAVIAAITQNPSRYAPDTNPDNNKVRQQAILDKMLELGFISRAEYTQAKNEKVYDNISKAGKIDQEVPSYHSFYVDQLYSEVVNDLKKAGHLDASNMVYNGGLKIYAAIDTDYQKIVDDVFLDDEYFPSRDFELDVVYRISTHNKITDKTTHHPEKKTTVKKYEEIQPFIESVKNELLGPNDEILAETNPPLITPQPQAAFVLIDYHTGYVKAIAGNRGEKLTNRAFNRATQAKRSPGSVFKVLASYAPALDMDKITPATVIDDAPYSANGRPVSNWYRGYMGLSTVRTGIIRSMNILAVKNLVDSGIDNAYNYLLNFGFTTLVEKDNAGNTDKVPSLALGGLTDGVTQLEVAAAYGTIANLGEYNRPKFYTKVFDHDNKLLLDSTDEPRQVLKKTTAYLLTDMMEDVLTASNGTGGKARFAKVKMPIAGKTGTTTDTKDLTFAGYTPYYVASIWTGFDQQKIITQDNGYHLRIWSTIMEKIHENLEYKEFEKPDGIVSVSICKDSGKLAVSGLCANDSRGNRLGSELFADGTQPTESCNVHTSITIDTYTKMKANQFCPTSLRKTIVGVITYDESVNVAEDGVYRIPRNIARGSECTLHNAFNSYVPNDPNAVYDPSLNDTPVDLGDPVPEKEPPVISETEASTATPSPTSLQEYDVPLYTQPITEPTSTPVPENNDYAPPTETPSLGDLMDTDSPVMDEPDSLDNFDY